MYILSDQPPFTIFDFLDKDAKAWMLSHVRVDRLESCHPEKKDQHLGLNGTLAWTYDPGQITWITVPTEISPAGPLPECRGFAQVFSNMVSNPSIHLAQEARALSYAYQWHLCSNYPNASLDQILQIDDYFPLLLFSCLCQLKANDDLVFKRVKEIIEKY